MLKTLCLFALTIPQLFAQAGYSNASLGMGQQAGRNAVIPDSNAIFVEEYFNYRRHNLPLPTGNEKVKLDLRWGSRSTDAAGNALLQVGIATARTQPDEIVPANICVVLDRSGSMQGDRIAHTREATKELIRRLRPQDRLSVVLFDDKAEVLIPSQLVKDPLALAAMIDNVWERGGTNLNIGLQLGYVQVAQHYNQSGSNKVIFLTDALANLGITDPTDILRKTGVYQEQMQIDLTMIGVGSNFNDELARLLTSKGHSIHFIMDSENIKKIFIDELESLLSPVGREVVLELEWDSSLQLGHFYGYNPTQNANKLSLPINNMNSGLTQIALLEFKGKGEVRANLVWKDAITQQPLSANTKAAIRSGHAASVTEDDADVQLNHTIAQMAEALRCASVLFHQQKERDALSLLTLFVNIVKKEYPVMNDDLKLVYDILATFKTNMENFKP